MDKLQNPAHRRQDHHHLRPIRFPGKDVHTDAIEELASAIRARRWAKLLALADRHRLEQDGSR